MEAATLVFSDTRLASVIIDEKITLSEDVLTTLSQIGHNCSVGVKNKFNDHLAQPGASNEHQCYCIAAMIFQNADSSLDHLECWDSAVEGILAAYPEPFAITIQNTEST